MYQDFYKLNADPFRLMPDPRFVFLHRSYRKAKAYMRHTLEQGDGFLVITGRSGTGKTMLVEDFLAGLRPEKTVIATLVCVKLEAADLLRMVAYAFGLDAKGLDKATLLRDIEQFLVRQPHALLIIDEAQNLPAELLEELRMLTNLHVRARPLLQIFLLGQEDLQERLHAPEMEQLHQRLMASCDLEPLSLQETRDYVLHRLKRAGWRGDPAISSSAFILIHRFSHGLPRYISKLCARLFLHGAVEHRHQFDTDDLVAVILEIQDELLLPLMSENKIDAGLPLSEIRKFIDSKSLPADWMANLTAEEQAFFEHNPAFTEAPPPSSPNPPEPAPATVTPVPQQPLPSAAAAAPEPSAKADKAMANAKIALARPYQNQNYGDRPRRSRRRRAIDRWKRVGYGLAIPLVLIATYLLGVHNTGEQVASIRTPPADFRIERPTVEPLTPSLETEEITTSALEAVGLLAPAQNSVAAGAAAPQTTAWIAANVVGLEPADEGTVTTQREQNGTEITRTEDTAETPTEISEAAAEVAEPVSEPLAVATEAPDTASLTAGKTPQQAVLDPRQETTDNDPVEQTDLLETAETSDAVSQTDSPVEVWQPAAPGRLPEPVPAGGTAMEEQVAFILTPSDTSADADPQQLSVEAPQLSEDNLLPMEPPPPTASETATLPDTGEMPQAADTIAPGSPLQAPATSGEPDDAATLAAVDTEKEEIENLLLLGEQALKSSRLRIPSEQSAWYYYGQVLELDPGNPAAERGLEQIVRRYAQLADRAMEKQQFEKARLFVNRGLGVIPADSALLALQQEIEKRHTELLAKQERERILELQAREARALAEAESRAAREQQETEGFFDKLDAFFAEGDAPSPEQVFQANDR